VSGDGLTATSGAMTVVFIDPIFLSNSAGFVTVFKNLSIYPRVLWPSIFLIRCLPAVAVNNHRPRFESLWICGRVPSGPASALRDVWRSRG